MAGPAAVAYMPAHHEDPVLRGLRRLATVVILATPFLLCFVGELGPEDGFTLFVFWILSMALLLGLPTATRIAAFIAEALRNYIAV